MKELVDIFKEIGMIREGHFELTSGLHSGRYFEKFRVLEFPEIATRVCKEIAEHFRSSEFATVAGPTTGGIIIAYEVARHLGKRCIFAEKTAEGRGFRRGFQIAEGEKILVVDDILTTGGSLVQTIDAIERKGGVAAGVGVIVDRSEKDLDLSVPVFSVHREQVKNWQPSECPLCKEGVELSKPGGG